MLYAVAIQMAALCEEKKLKKSTHRRRILLSLVQIQ
jgi:hypothetical protein